MTETGQAFDHPLARSLALSGDAPADRISLRDYVRKVEIGAFQVERGVTQTLRFNVVVEVAPPDTGPEDDVDRILSYDRVSEAIDSALAAGRLNLLETLAEHIATRILAEPLAARVFVRIEKLDRGPWVLGVEIMRDRPTAAATATPPPAPLFLHLGTDAQKASHLIGWLAQCSAAAPVVISAAPATDRPRAATTAAQLRIDLLAMEQAAWSLSALVPGLDVVATRTELDWALRRARACLWAPSKLILDTPAAPITVGESGLEVANWLARDLHSPLRLLVAATGAAGWDRHDPTAPQLPVP
ncbi:dihydroneopterin aldolase [Pseudooceanicola aestuarii]|uniref:dihydroneopterin aldolase n=1 Tax=Pseudooceanicola aestuarii TaxID=2697319 RepID=UPI0013D19520|nr:dihydroneopterin aldolase [Pseudooceanicola aestuarii]